VHSTAVGNRKEKGMSHLGIEGLSMEVFPIAQAAKNSGGIVIQSAKKLVFAGTFTAGGLELEIGDGKLKII
jgi:propionate CoA-transferase